MAIAERIHQARTRQGYSQSQLASMVGVTRGACGQWERGISSPSIENLSQLAIMLDVSFEWLATGRGEMAGENAIMEPAATRYGHKPGLTDEQRELLACYGRLSAPKQQALIRFLQTL